MSGAVATAVVYTAVATTAINVASSTYQSKKQREASSDAQARAAAAKKEDDTKRADAAAAAKRESDRIARETKPEEQGLQEIEFGAEGRGSTGAGSTQDFLVPKMTSLGSSGRSGLGFKV